MAWLKKNLWAVAAGGVLTLALLAAVWQAGREHSEPVEASPAALSAEEAFDTALAWHDSKYPELSDYGLEGRRTLPAEGYYDIRFTRGGYDFRYEVSSQTGFVRAEETEYEAGTLQSAFLQDLPEPSQREPESGPERPESLHPAIWAALEHAGLEAAAVSQAEVQTEYDGAQPMCYAVRFRCGDTLYGYEIGLDGASVLAWEKQSDQAAPEQPDVGRDAALAAALAESGVTREEAKLVRVRKETEEGRAVYTVLFRVDRTEYEYKIDAATGEVIREG